MAKPAVGTSTVRHEGGDDPLVGACYGTPLTTCSEPVPQGDSPCKQSRRVSVLPLTVLRVCYWVKVGCIFGHSKGGLMISRVWTSTGRTVWLALHPGVMLGKRGICQQAAVMGGEQNTAIW